jgi:O-antigen ligase
MTLSRPFSLLPFGLGLVALSSGLALAYLPPLWGMACLLGVGLLVLALSEPALALLLLAVFAPMKALIETETAYPLPLDVGQVLLGLVLVAWVLTLARRRQRQIYLPIVLFVGLGFFLFGAGVSIFNARNLSLFLNEWLKWFQVALLTLIVANCAGWRWALTGVLLSAALQGLLGLWQFYGGSGAAHLWILDYRFFRAFGTFGQPNPFGAFMGMTLPIALALSLGALLTAWQTRHDRGYFGPAARDALIFGGFSLCISLGLLTSWSRGAWLSGLAALGTLVVLLPRQRGLGFGLAGGGALIGWLLWTLGLLPKGLTDRLLGFTQDFIGFQDVRGVVISDANYAVIERLAHWQAALDMSRDHFWAGVGFGNYAAAYPDYALINWENPLGHAHNYYLNLWAETGIIGLVSYVGLWGLIFGLTLEGLRQAKTEADRALGAGLMGTWVYMSVHSLLDKLYVNNLFLHLGILLGVLVWLRRSSVRPTHKGEA